MDEEIRVRYREFKIRDEIKKKNKIEKGQMLNDLAVARAMANTNANKQK